ncbi:MAG: hypothetical protein BWK79_07655 [Beggiatoa sp. IS2]|nr:MAG: hypothetical protein BWK79_07655 [Beggiatoa sp. IS2]
MTFHQKNLKIMLFLMIVMALGGTKAFIDYRLNLSIEQWIISTLPRVTTEYHAEYATAIFSLLGAMVISKLHLTDGHKTFEIDQLVLKKAYQLYRLNAIPQHLRLVLHQIRWTVHDQDTTVPVLVTLSGYNPYYINFNELNNLGCTQADIYLSADLEENSWHLSMRIVETTGSELSMTVTANCSHCTLAQGANVISSLALTEIVVNYSDNGLIKKVFNFLSKRQSAILTTFKHTLFNRLSNDIRQSPLILDPQALEQLRQFIETPNHLSVQLSVNPPLAAKQLETMNLGKSRFTLKITTSSP